MDMGIKFSHLAVAIPSMFVTHQKNSPILDAVMDVADENLVLSTKKYKSNYIELSVTEMPAFEY